MLLIQHALLPPVLLADADQWYQHYYNATMSVQAFTKTSLLQRLVNKCTLLITALS